jgi:hypothetical protein
MKGDSNRSLWCTCLHEINRHRSSGSGNPFSCFFLLVFTQGKDITLDSICWLMDGTGQLSWIHTIELD